MLYVERTLGVERMLSAERMTGGMLGVERMMARSACWAWSDAGREVHAMRGAYVERANHMQVYVDTGGRAV